MKIDFDQRWGNDKILHSLARLKQKESHFEKKLLHILVAQTIVTGHSVHVIDNHVKRN